MTDSGWYVTGRKFLAKENLDDTRLVALREFGHLRLCDE
jgi:hypothetical protein